MNCLHYSIPGTETIRGAIAHLSIGKSESANLRSPEHLSCHRLLTKLAQSLESPVRDSDQRAESVEATEVVIAELSHDMRVRKSLGEYYGIRLLQAEARSAIVEYRQSGDTSGFDRLGSKLRRELEPEDYTEVESDSKEEPASEVAETSFRPPQFFKKIARVAGFLMLLSLVLAGMLLAGTFFAGIGF